MNRDDNDPLIIWNEELDIPAPNFSIFEDLKHDKEICENNSQTKQPPPLKINKYINNHHRKNITNE